MLCGLSGALLLLEIPENSWSVVREASGRLQANPCPSPFRQQDRNALHLVRGLEV